MVAVIDIINISVAIIKLGLNGTDNVNPLITPAASILIDPYRLPTVPNLFLNGIIANALLVGKMMPAEKLKIIIDDTIKFKL